MDRTTKWLLRSASIVVILSGLGAMSIFIVNSKILQTSNLKFTSKSTKEESFEDKKEKCRSRARIGIQSYSSCLNSTYAKGSSTRRTEKFVHKGTTYTASRACPKGQNMRWIVNGVFRKKVYEMGCMTSEQFKMAKMEMEIKGLKRAIRANALNDASNTINNLFQQQQINTNTWRLNN